MSCMVAPDQTLLMSLRCQRKHIVPCASAPVMDIFSVINSHRSIRKYQQEPVPRALVDEILAAGTRASSSGNMQTYSVIAVEDPAVRRRLYQPLMEQSMVLDAPLVMVFCADFNRMRHWLRVSDAADGFDNYMSFMVAAIDAVLAAQTAVLAAEAKGLGICYMGSTFANTHLVGQALGCPRGVVPVIGFSLGWPDEEPAERARLPQDGVVHWDRYEDYSDERVKEIYRERETEGWKRYAEFPHLKAQMEASGVENLAQVYSQLKYTRETHTGYSQNVLEYLKSQEFMENTL